MCLLAREGPWVGCGGGGPATRPTAVTTRAQHFNIIMPPPRGPSPAPAGSSTHRLIGVSAQLVSKEHEAVETMAILVSCGGGDSCRHRRSRQIQAFVVHDITFSNESSILACHWQQCTALHPTGPMDQRRRQGPETSSLPWVGRAAPHSYRTAHIRFG